ncbi:hypothetical protein SNK03_010771 [Fusarium graminearum]
MSVVSLTVAVVMLLFHKRIFFLLCNVVDVRGLLLVCITIINELIAESVFI